MQRAAREPPRHAGRPVRGRRLLYRRRRWRWCRRWGRCGRWRGKQRYRGSGRFRRRRGPRGGQLHRELPPVGDHPLAIPAQAVELQPQRVGLCARDALRPCVRYFLQQRPTLPEQGKALADQPGRSRTPRPTERLHRFGRRVAERQHAQAMRVQELERGIARRYLRPESPDAEIPLAHVGVVEQHHPPARQLRLPGGKVVRHVLVAVPAVDMQQIHRAVRDMGQRRIEGAAQQAREPAVARVMEGAPVGEHRLVIEARVLVARPGVHRVAACIEPGGEHRVAQCRVGDPRVAAELDDHARPRGAHDPAGEGHMAVPGAVHPDAARAREQRPKRGGEQRTQPLVQFRWRLPCPVGPPVSELIHPRAAFPLASGIF